jgi:hypothetical protein
MSNQSSAQPRQQAAANSLQEAITALQHEDPQAAAEHVDQAKALLEGTAQPDLVPVATDQQL